MGFFVGLEVTFFQILLQLLVGVVPAVADRASVLATMAVVLLAEFVDPAGAAGSLDALIIRESSASERATLLATPPDDCQKIQKNIRF